MTQPTASQLAFSAADILAEHGHVKNQLTDGVGYCLVGAVAAAQHLAVYGSLPTDTPSVYAGADINFARHREVIAMAHKLVQVDAGIDPNVRLRDDQLRYATAATWNNDQDTSPEDVILVLKRAGMHLEAEGR